MSIMSSGGMPESKTIKRQRQIAAGFFAALFVVVLSAVFNLAGEVLDDLERQRTASSDNVQWTLTQVEVEYLSFVNAVEHAAHQPAPPGSWQLVELRKQFDVFYSRVDTFSSARLFADLRLQEDYADALHDVRAFLDASVPTIDAEDAVLANNMEALLQSANAIAPKVRALSLSGLSYFAELSDQRRADTARTLIRLAAVIAAMLVMLIAVTLFLLMANRKARKRRIELQQANARTRTVLSTSLDAVIVVNSNGKVLDFNPAAEAIFQRTLDEVQGKSIGDLIVPPHMRGAHKEGIERMQRGGARHVVGQGRVQLEAMRADGSIFPVELALESAFDGSEEIVIGYVRDISNRVAAEKELISARDKALAGEQAKAEFLTVMSHEIRTPLNGLLGNLSLLTKSRLSTDQKKLTQNMEISGQILMNHVDSVLDIARFEAGKLTALSEKLDLNAMMQDIVDGQSGNAASRGNAISWGWVGPAAPWVLSDEQRLRQILLNLVGNAIKFTEDGRVSLEVECTSLPDETGRFEYEFRVIDTGIGIDAAETDRIFQDFVTSDPSIGRSVGGTGLGLGIARRFISTLGGEIGVESTPGEGSVFWIRLPLKQTTSQRAQSDQPSGAALVRPLDILVVEDNEINAEVLRRMLELDQHRVSFARNGLEGVQAAEAQAFDVILMDVSMPVLDGPSATRRIRSGDGPCKQTPIVAVSANVLPGAIESFREAGMDGFLGKPLTVESLRDTLASILGTPVQTPAREALSTLETLAEDLGRDILLPLLEGFMQENDALSLQLGAADLSADAASALAAECHKQAGSAGIMGFETFRQALLACESAAAAGELDAFRTAARSCRADWSAIRPAVQALLDQQ